MFKFVSGKTQRRGKKHRMKRPPVSKRFLSHRELMDAMIKHMFSHGGPMLPTEIKKRHEERVYILNPRPKPCPALLAEQKRLIKTWNRN